MAKERPINNLIPIPCDPANMVGLIQDSLEDHKAEELLVIDLHGKTTIADYMIIATGRSTRQVAAMAVELLTRLKTLGVRATAEGLREGDWVLVDAGDVIVHLFRPEVRTFYNLEKMWGGRTVEDRRATAGV